MLKDKDKKDSVIDIPIQILLMRLTGITQEITTGIRIVFVLKGELILTLGTKRNRLQEDDLVLINCGESYVIEAEKPNLTFQLELDGNWIEHALHKEHLLFCCNTVEGEHKHRQEAFHTLKRLMVKLLYLYTQKAYAYELGCMSLIYQLVQELMQNFLMVDASTVYTKNQINDKYVSRIESLLSYVRLNYQQPITLGEAAKEFFITPEYLSRFFRRQMDTTFSKYLNEYRLKQAVKELLMTQNSVTKIAMEHGFPNLASFNRMFKESYDTTPAVYRGRMQNLQLISKEKQFSNKILQQDLNQAFEILGELIGLDEQYNEMDILSNTVRKQLVLADAREQTKMEHSFRKVINLGYAEDGLRSDIQTQFMELQKTIRFECVRFQGILSDEMLIEEEERQSQSTMNFTKIDKLLDFLLSIGLRPFLELGEKAKIINRDIQNILFMKSNSKRDRTMAKSTELLKRFLLHCVNRYGVDEVEKWHFELWKPGEVDYIRWDGNFDCYLDRFQSCYQVVKEIVPNAKVGGPGLNPEINVEWLEALIESWKKRGTMPDFLSVSLYAYEFLNDRGEEGLENKSYGLTVDANYMNKQLDRIAAILQKTGEQIPEIHVTEWNSSVSHRHPSNDTVFKAAFIVKNVLQNQHRVNSLGYWLCSDISGELSDSKTFLYGDLGLVSIHGIKKPGYFAYEMLSKLGTYLIKRGEGCIVTSRGPHRYEVLFYNYKHFDPCYCLQEEPEISYERYYEIYEDQQELAFELNLQHLCQGKYRIRKHTLSREHGSIFDEWMRMNAIRSVSQTEIEYFKQICIPRQTIWYEDVVDSLCLSSKLTAHELNLFEISLEWNEQG